MWRTVRFSPRADGHSPARDVYRLPVTSGQADRKCHRSDTWNASIFLSGAWFVNPPPCQRKPACTGRLSLSSALAVRSRTEDNLECPGSDRLSRDLRLGENLDDNAALHTCLFARADNRYNHKKQFAGCPQPLDGGGGVGGGVSFLQHAAACGVFFASRRSLPCSYRRPVAPEIGGELQVLERLAEFNPLSQRGLLCCSRRERK